MDNDLDLLLLYPPGWDATTGGPYLAGPLLAGYLKTCDFSAATVDLNIEAANDCIASIGEVDAFQASLRPETNSMNDLFYSRQDKLTSLAKSWDGKWELKFGFQFNQVNLSDPCEVLAASKLEAPYSEFLERRVQEILSIHNPLVIGITATVPTQLVSTFYLARIIKKLSPSTLVILGGNMSTRLIEEMKINEVFEDLDGIVGFGGELALSYILTALKDCEDWRLAPNLMTHNKGAIKLNASKTLPTSKFAMPAFDGLDLEAYWGAKYLPIVGSRGCYYGKCSFCAIPFSWGAGGFLGNDSAEKIVGFISETTKNTKIDRWKFIEESLHPGLVRKISEVILQTNLKIEWEGYARLDTPWINSDLLEIASRAGLKKLYVGLELIPGDGRDLLNKNDVVDPLVFLKECKKHGIKVHLFTMVGSPGSSHEEAIDTIEFLISNQELIDTVDCSVFEYAKHTEMEGVRRIYTDGDWSLASAFEPTEDSVMTMYEAEMIGHALEEKLWQHKPEWLHPVYRMVTPWTHQS